MINYMPYYFGLFVHLEYHNQNVHAEPNNKIYNNDNFSFEQF